MIPRLEANRRKRHRSTITETQREVLEAEYAKNQMLPAIVRRQVAEQTGLSEGTVRVWFQNQRQRRTDKHAREVYPSVDTSRMQCAVRMPSTPEENVLCVAEECNANNLEATRQVTPAAAEHLDVNLHITSATLPDFPPLFAEHVISVEAMANFSPGFAEAMAAQSFAQGILWQSFAMLGRQV